MNRNHRDPSTAHSWPSAEQAAELFAQLTASDPCATSDLAAAYIDPLIAHLCANNPYVDDHLCQEAAEQALVSLFKNPAQFKSDRGELAMYLKMSARKDLLNLLAREAKHHKNRTGLDSVELDAAARNNDDEDEDPDRPTFKHPALIDVIRDFSEEERIVFEFMRDGERCTEAFAAALGWEDLPRDEQSDRIKRVKDRIKQRLKRAVEGLS